MKKSTNSLKGHQRTDTKGPRPHAAEQRLFTAEDVAPSPALLTAVIFTQKYLVFGEKTT